MKVYLDSGHGGKDSGAVGIGGRLEKEGCQRLTDLVTDIVERAGITCVVNTNPDQTLAEVVNQANKEKVDLFISIHRNAFSDSNANGLEVWTCPNPKAVTRRNAEIMYEKLCNVTPEMTKRGIKENNFYVLKYTNSPAMLLEMGFVTNPKDNDLFDKYIFEYAIAIAKGICEILGASYVQRTYTVQIGAYSDRRMAEAAVSAAKTKGFSEACIV